MGIRIMINWEFISPLLKVATGKCKVEYINLKIMDHKPKTILEFEVSKHEGSTEFKDINKMGISTALFKRVEEYTKLMIDSYFQGMILENTAFHWIEKSLDKTFEQWLEETETKGLTDGLDKKS